MEIEELKRRDVSSKPLDPVLEPFPEQEGNPPVKAHFWQRHGFKRISGLTLVVAGGILKLAYPPAGILAEGIAMAGGLLFGGGVIHWEIKRQQGVDMTKDNLIRSILELLVKIVEYLKTKGKDNG